MTTIPKKRIVIGWIQETLWVLLNLLLLPFTFFIKKIHFNPNSLEDPKSAVILCDALTSPLAYTRLAWGLKKSNYSVIIYSSGSIFSHIRDHAKQIAEFLESADLNQVTLFGHGMGGLSPLKLPDAARQRIKHLVPIGTPYNGTRLLMPMFWIPALSDMAVGSQYILFNRTNTMLYNEFTPFCAWQDETIIPFNLSRYGQGRDLILDQVGHLNLVLNTENIATIISIVNGESLDDLPAPEIKKPEPTKLRLVSKAPRPWKKKSRAVKKKSSKKTKAGK